MDIQRPETAPQQIISTRASPDLSSGPVRPGPVLILAPHNDDEVLGVGGLIQRHLERDDPVTVVLMTNGDGQYRGPFRNRRRAVRFGYHRQRETLRALDELGLDADQVVFLGYPDRGLARLWNRYWRSDQPYTSPQTGARRSPYANSLTPDALYCGSSVIRDLQHLMRAHRPRTIYLPHPNDFHPDHWSTEAFCRYALEGLKRQRETRDWDDVCLLTYVVHRGRWPLPRGRLFSAELQPPRSLTALDTDWLKVPLIEDEVRTKHRAILKHRTQVRYMRLYLESFARANELFGEVPRLQLTRRVHVADSADRGIAELVSGDGASSPEASSPIVSYLDPRHRRLLGNLHRYNDIRALHLALEDAHRLSIEVECFERLHPHNQILVHLKTVDGDDNVPTSWRFLRTTRGLTLNEQPVERAGISSSTGMKTFRLSIPLDDLGSPTAFVVGAELLRRGLTFAKSAYRLVELTQVPEEIRS